MSKRIFTVILILCFVFPFVGVTDADAPLEGPESAAISAENEVENLLPSDVPPDGEPSADDVIKVEQETSDEPIKEDSPEDSSPEPESTPTVESPIEVNTPVEETDEPADQEMNEQEPSTSLPEPDSPEEIQESSVEPVSQVAFLNSPKLTIREVSDGLVLTFNGQSKIGNIIPEKASIVFQVPEELIGSIKEESLSLEYSQKLLHSEGSLVNELSGAFTDEEIQLDLIANQVRVPLNVQDSSEYVSDFAFTLRIPLGGQVDQKTDWMFYAQIVSEPTNLTLLETESVGYAVMPVDVEVTPDLTAPEDVQTKTDLTRNSAATYSAMATATQTSRLTFKSVPETLEFEDVYMVDEEVTVVRKNPDWSIEIEDTRGAGSTWSLMMRATPLTSTVNSSITVPDALVFKDNTEKVSVIQDQDVEVIKGTTDVNPVTHLSWDWNKGPLLRFNPSTVEAGSYSASITWTLVDAP